MTPRCGLGAVLAGVLLLVLGLAGGVAANDTVTGLVVESGMSAVVLQGADGATTKYNLGVETNFIPGDYRPGRGDTVTLEYYAKTLRSGEDVLAVAKLTMVSKDPNRKDLESPAQGTIREVGRKSLRIDIPAVGQVVSMDLGRNMEKKPADWKPAVGDKVTVHFNRVKSSFGVIGLTNLVNVISILEKNQ